MSIVKTYRAVELDVDSSAVVKVIKDGTTSSATGVSLLKSIRRLLEFDWNVKINHYYREANMCAHVMANLGCFLEYAIIFFAECPRHIKNLLMADYMGFLSPRLILM
jgi:hypothetical protein